MTWEKFMAGLGSKYNDVHELIRSLCIKESNKFLIEHAVSSMASMNTNEDVKFVPLPDGRRISYREQGVGKEMAKRSLLVLHGLGSSRVAGMPGKCIQSIRLHRW